MRLIQHKKEAFWFYRFLSVFYDNYVNPFFWTEKMRNKALSLARLNRPELMTLDVGSGTGFTTLGIVQNVNPQRVFCIDQSPHQMAKAKQKAQLQNCNFQLADAENLPFPSNYFDRYVSAGSIEYWPNPQQGIWEAFRVTKPGGITLIIGPLKPRNRIARFIADSWMLFPDEKEYMAWFQEAGFIDIKKSYIAPHWIKKEKYGIAISGVKSTSKEFPNNASVNISDHPVNRKTILHKFLIVYRVVIGSLAAFLFIPYALFARMKIQIFREQNDQSVEALTKQQKITLLIIGSVFLIIVLRVLF